MSDIMNDVIINLNKNNWPIIKKYIKNNQIEYDELIDQTNGVIHYLAYHNMTDLIKLIDNETLLEIIKQPNLEGETVGHIAAKLNNNNLLDFLISVDPSIIYVKNKLNCTPLFYLLTNHELIKQLVELIDIDDHYLSDEYTLLEYYVLEKNLIMFHNILSNISLNTLSNDVIFTIIQSDEESEFKLELLSMIQDYPFDINWLNKQLLTPLIVAVHQKDYLITEYLLKCGANISYYGPDNNDHPLTIAINNSDTQIIKLLLAHNIDCLEADKNMKTPVHHLFAVHNQIPTNIKQKILARIPNLNTTDNRMNSILNLLIHNDNWKLYENILEENKLKIYLPNKAGTKPIDGVEAQDLDLFWELVYKSYLYQLDSDIDWLDPKDNDISLILENDGDIQPYRDYIMDKLKNNQSYPLKRKSSIIKLIVPPKTNITHFSAYTYNYICYLYYILAKYSEIKIPGLAPDQMLNKTLKMFYDELIQDYTEKTPENAIFRSIIRDYVNHSPILINHVIIWKSNEMYFFSPYFVQGIHQTLIKYPETRYILLKLTIITEQHFNHANMIIYDVKNKVIERFDPYGNVNFNYANQIDLLLKMVFHEYYPDIKYLSPKKMLNGVSYQIFADESNNNNYVENDPNGFCVAWCLWYVETRFNNSNVHPKTLIKKTVYQINKNDDKFKDYIRDYSNYIDTQKNIILQKGNVPEKYWYTLHIPFDIYRAYLRYIRNIYHKIA